MQRLTGSACQLHTDSRRTMVQRHAPGQSGAKCLPAAQYPQDAEEQIDDVHIDRGGTVDRVVQRLGNLVVGVGRHVFGAQFGVRLPCRFVRMQR
jgi:hypothetical protein